MAKNADNGKSQPTEKAVGLPKDAIGKAGSSKAAQGGAPSTGAMQTIKHIYAIETAKALGGVYGLVGAAFGVLVLLLFLLDTITGGGMTPILIGIGILVGSVVMLFISGFISTAVGAVIYNIFSGIVGGVRWQCVDGTLKRFGAMSVGKLCAAIGFVFSVLVSIFLLLIILFMPSIQNYLLIGIVAFIVFVTILSFITGVVEALLYNLVAGLVGGIKLAFDGKALGRIDAVSAGKVNAVFGALMSILVILFGLFTIVLVVGVLGTNFLHMLPQGALPPGMSAANIAAQFPVMTLPELIIVLLVVPVFDFISTLIFGFINGVLFAWLYNIVAKRNFGRIMLELE